MNIDFHQQFKDYSNTDLMKIVLQSEAYQPAAVAVAARILEERQVTPADLQAIDQYFDAIEASRQAKAEKAEALRSKAGDFLQPLTHPGETVEPRKWVNILLLIIGVQYAWSLFQSAKSMIAYLDCYNCRLDAYFFAQHLNLLYVPVIFFLLYRRSRWGWILLFADNLFVLISSLGQAPMFFQFQDIHGGSTYSFLVTMVVKATFLFFLWRPSIAAHFGILPQTKEKTAVMTAIGTVVFIVLMYLAYS